MYLIRDFLDQRFFMLICYALIALSISYYLAVWGGASNEVLKPLVAIQKRAVRIISGLRALDHTGHAFRS